MTTELINKDIFRTYDIRGQVGREWCVDDNYHDAFLIGQSIGSQLKHRDSPSIVVGRDGRISSSPISEQLLKGLVSVGCLVTDIGVVATPVTYFALSHLHINNCIMVTGSHNPPDHNGIKIVYESTPLSKIVIETLYHDISRENFETNDNGKLFEYNNIIDEYQKAIIDNISINKPLRIGIDACNGATALFAESLYTQLGCKVYPLYCEMDGTFPNHSPDPTVPENLEALAALVKKEKLDLGIAFDGDGDRMIAVDNQGNLLWPDRIMILLAKAVLKEKPSSPVVYDVKCSFLLPTAIRQFGGQPSMCMSGHSILKLQMLQLNAAMGGEFSGHIVMRDRWSDFDDGPYVAARLLEVIANSEQSPTEIYQEIPDSYSTREFQLHFDHTDLALEVLGKFIRRAEFSGADLSLIDGLRVDYDDGWGLIRSSNTIACLTFRFEAVSLERLGELKDQFRFVFERLNKDRVKNNQAPLVLPF